MKCSHCFKNALACMHKACPAPCRMILDSVSEGICMVDHKGIIAWMNQSAEQITGFNKEEAEDRPFREIFQTYSDAYGPDFCPIDQILHLQESVSNLEIKIRNRKGHTVPVTISTSLIRDPENNILGALQTFRDLTSTHLPALDLRGEGPFKNILTRNPRMLGILRHLKDIAVSDSPILLCGESGTGKDLLARAVHDLSERDTGPYIATNCGALPDTLMESELFGYRKGAFTDAREDKPGRFTLAEGGTLFLDEIGDLPLEVQVKLLRVLQGGEYQPLGGTETIHANVRIITATNKDLFEQMGKGLFREDLFYRISVVQIDVPPLRKRPEDIPLLIEHFLGILNAKRGKSIAGLSPVTEKILMTYEYPGNIREMENILEYATIVCKHQLIEPRHLPPYLHRKKEESDRAPDVARNATDLRQLERDEIIQTLKEHRWNRQTAAAALGISRTTLWRKIRRFHIPT